MRNRILFNSLVVIILIIIWVLWLYFNSALSPITQYTPEAYTKKVNELINAHLLSVSCPPDGPPQIDDSRLRANSATASQRLWYTNSYLREDIQHFNEDPKYAWTFVLSDVGCELVEIHPRAHRIAMPFARQDDWKGAIFYSGAATGTALKSIKRQITLQQPNFNNQNSTKVLTTEIGNQESIEAEQIQLQAKRSAVASIYHVGDQLVVNNLMRLGDAGGIGLMGYAMPIGRRAWLDTGDWLQIQAGNPLSQEVFIFVNSTPQPIASIMHRRNDHDERDTQDDQLGWFYDNDTDQPIPFLTALAQRISTLVNSRPIANSIAANFNVQLSVDPQLQHALSGIFHKICDQHRHNNNSGHPFKAGITVMDGKTGNILATATYPWPEDVLANTKGRDRLLLNQNFIRHPIGSIIKPFLYSSIANTYPYFLNMSIDGHGADPRHQDILYCKVKPGYKIRDMWGGPALDKTNLDKTKKRNNSHYTIDFATALTRSSNKYTVELATLALAAGETAIKATTHVNWPNMAKSGINFNGRRLDKIPDLSAYIEIGDHIVAPVPCSQLQQMQNLPYLTTLEQITGVSTYLGMAPQHLNAGKNDMIYQAYRAQSYDTLPLRPLVEHFVNGDVTRKWEVRNMLAGIAPERVNLDFNHFNNFRQDYISLTLGGGSSVWTNVQVAEAMSRLITDRAVTANLITGLLSDTGQFITTQPAPTAPINLNLSVREQVLKGLSGVVNNPAGTAKKLQKQFNPIKDELAKQGQRLFIFSKTGTPTVERAVYRDIGEILKQLYRSYLSYQDNKLQIIFNQQVADYIPENVQKFTYILKKALAKLGYRGNNLDLIADDILEIFNTFYLNNHDGDSDETSADMSQDSETGDNSGPLEIVDGKLSINLEDKLFSQKRYTSRAAAYVFSLVKIPTALMGAGALMPTPEQIQDPRTQVITTAIYLDLPFTSSAAVSIAGAVIKTISAFDSQYTANIH